MHSDAREPDVLIVGGGLVGSALAYALAPLPIRVLLVEAHDPRTLEQPSFDGRVTALANGSQRILAGLGLWPRLANDAEPIRSIHISERGQFGAARIDARDEGVAALGYTVENQALGRLLWSRLQPDGGVPFPESDTRADPNVDRFEILAPARITALHVEEHAAVAEIDTAGGRVIIRTKLLVAADGARSWVRDALGIAARRHDYGQHALILNCSTELPHRGRAFERFTPSGPLAVLPLVRDRVAIIWTQRAGAAERLLALSDDAFGRELQTAFGFRLGRFLRVGERSVHPLAHVKSDPVHQHRVVLIGNAALTLHPVAGQGFNLALRDVATLADVLRDEVLRDAHTRIDVGARAVLDRYRTWRRADQRRVSRFTHGLVQLFGIEAPGARVARGLGLVAFDLLPRAKAVLAKQTMGRAGRLPRLARGLDLTS